MSRPSDELVLPRPGTQVSSEKPVQGPSESSFVKTFGPLLPPAKYLNKIPHGKAAYYEILPSTSQGPIDRVLFIHGVQTPAIGMLPLAKALEKSFPGAHLVLVDLWGHGLSDTPILPHQPSLFHQLIDDLLDHLGWASAHLVGFSFGGVTTSSYVVARPNRVKSFTLIAPAGLLRFSDFTTEQQNQLRGDDEVAAKKFTLEFLEGGDLVVPEDWKQRVAKGEVVAEAVREWQMREHPGHVASVVAIFRDGGVMDSHSQFSKASQTGIPNLAVLGELDDLVSAEQLEEHGFRNVFVVPQVGHGVVRDRVKEVATLVSDFWNKLDVSA
ncbi:dihydrolipoyllysine-residue acetyltransferase component of acetoin cleaving system [Fusarium longipes]|uniref:Dihydrolipoyllysine-residue acetyltransferase component of acetoin cleaving system n=1 Tax=Fusarium longipes TaxID=694270 RepID=A0A395RNK4_9HYPO|nr:dihydrolipoyllysine-residue acetyltransferase component of acetoin cleaving system [Fusarium longipes]